jgi:hypothetical protein
LHTLELAVDAASQSVRKGSFADAGHVFDQNMAAREQADEHQVQRAGMPKENGLNILSQPRNRIVDHEFTRRSGPPPRSFLCLVRLSRLLRPYKVHVT